MAATEKRPDLIALASELNGVPMCDDYEKMISGMLCVASSLSSLHRPVQCLPLHFQPQTTQIKTRPHHLQVQPTPTPPRRGPSSMPHLDGRLQPARSPVCPLGQNRAKPFRALTETRRPCGRRHVHGAPLSTGLRVQCRHWAGLFFELEVR